MLSRLKFLKFPLLAALLSLAAAALVFPRSASAHSRPVRFDPPESAVLQTPPTQVQGWFGSPVRRDPNWSFIHVADAQGNRVDTGDTALSSDRMSMTETLKPNIPPGRYLVTWRTYDDGDGEIFGNCFTIFVGQQAADQAAKAKYRLDGGRDCSSIEINAEHGTPTPLQVSAAATAVVSGEAAADENSGQSGSSDGGTSTGKLLVFLVIGAVAGLAVGGAGGRLLGRRQ